MSETAKRLYILYDGRAHAGGSTDDAVILETCDTLSEARRNAPDYGQCSCWSYAMGELLTNERWEFDYWPEDAT